MTDRQGNSATMQGIRILQSWNCVLEIANGVDREISIKNGELQQKGIGILNIERCVNTYEGSISYTYRHRQLACSILLNRTEDCRERSI